MPVLARAESSEIFYCLGTGVLEEFHLDPPRRGSTDGNVEKDYWIAASDSLQTRNRMMSWS